MANNAINMCEKDILEDFLSSQKQITANYNTFAGECEHTNLRDTFLGILSEEHHIQTELFDEMHNRGWYPVKTAEQTEIDAVKQKFSMNG
ncbi:MAG: spore coat protein [Clostridiaceae bacterium]|nr:spore coat protein [Clostridiaceae bacterium]